MRRGFGALALGAAIALTSVGTVFAFPDKPVRMVVPFGAGGSSDITARLIQQLVEQNKLLSQPIVVVNMPGAGSAIGARHVKDADPDGHTVLMHHSGLSATFALGLSDFTPADFVPVAEFGSHCNMWVVKDKGPLKTFEDVVNASKNGGIRETTNPGSIIYFVSQALAKAAGLNIRYITAGASPERVAHLLGDHAETAVFSTTELATFAEQGVRPVLTFSPDPDPFVPDLPTARSKGYDVAFCNSNWIFAPKATPAATVSVLADAFEAAYKLPETKATLTKKGIQATFYRGEALAERVADAHRRIMAVGIQKK